MILKQLRRSKSYLKLMSIEHHLKQIRERRFPDRWGARRQVNISVPSPTSEKNHQALMDKFAELSLKVQASDSGLI
jgi:hypothetical protein